MWWSHHGFHPFGLVLFALLIGLVAFRIFTWRRHGGGCHRFQDGRLEAEGILKRRLANGEISEEEFNRLKEILSK